MVASVTTTQVLQTEPRKWRARLAMHSTYHEREAEHRSALRYEHALRHFRELHWPDGAGPAFINAHYVLSLMKQSLRPRKDIQEFIAAYRAHMDMERKEGGPSPGELHASVSGTLQKLMVILDKLFFSAIQTDWISDAESPRKGFKSSKTRPLVRLNVVDGRDIGQCLGLFTPSTTDITIWTKAALWTVNQATRMRQLPFDGLVWCLVHEMVHAYIDILMDHDSEEWQTRVAPDGHHGDLHREIETFIMGTLSTWIPEVPLWKWMSDQKNIWDRVHISAQSLERIEAANPPIPIDRPGTLITRSLGKMSLRSLLRRIFARQKIIIQSDA